ncbi:MAG: cell division protein FtsA [Muribaculaceae bacterium]|nr:cell division protein FtsA [Muribaculaceae bacterium]
MSKSQYIAALEIGSSKIVGAIAEKTNAGYVQVNHLEVEKLINSVRHGCVQNVENTKGCINSIIRKLENRIDGTIDEVYVGFSGRSLHSEPTEVNHTLDATVPITDEVLDRIVAEAGRDPIKNYETIKVVPRTYYVDKNETKSPSGQFGSNINIKLNLIVARPNLKLNLDRVMTGSTRVREYLVTPLVVADEILESSEKSLGCMLVDLGAETTTVSIYKDGSLVYLTTLPLGGRNITRDITVGLNVLEDTAERVKKNISNPLDKNVDHVSIEGVNSTDAANYIVARTGEIIANIKQQISYAGVKIVDLHNIVLIGGGAQLQGIARSIEDSIKLKVRLGTHPKNLNILDHNINRAEYVQLFSLLSNAAQNLPYNQSCVRLNTYGNTDEDYVAPDYGNRGNDEIDYGYKRFRDEEPRQSKQSRPEANERPEPRRQKKVSWLEKARKKMENLIKEPEEDEE